MADKDYEADATELVQWARGKMRECVDATGDWREEALESYGLVAGDQWDDVVRAQLEEQGRPVFTFNRVAGFIRGICGLESSTRNQVRFYAREIDDSGASDVTNAAVKWVRENCDAEDEEADAFKDMLICGLGWTETYYSTEEDPEGEIIVERVDPLHMRWDSASRKRGLADRRWCARVKWLPLSVIKDVWGKKKADELEAIMSEDTEILDEYASTPHDATAAREYEAGSMGEARRKNGVPVVQFQYAKTVRYYTVLNPLTGAQEEVSAEDFEKANDRLEEAVGMGLTVLKRYQKRQYRQLIYAGVTELEDAELVGGFTLNPITGIRDRNTGTWYGFVRDMLDPQRWINKFFSSMADVVASQAKGGLLAEVDAFVNKQQAQDEWADPRSIVWMKSGGLGKVQERQSAGIPAGFSQLLEFTVSSLPHVAGVNLEFLGLAGREQAGVLETQRKQAAIATLSEFFNALRLYRKQQGRVLVKMIYEYIGDGRLIRVVGKQGAQFVPLAQEPGALQYDLVVDEAPDSPDQKGRTWEALMQVLPAASRMGFPIPPDVIEYAPFPQALIQDWMKFAQGEAGLPPEQKERIQQMQEQISGLQNENQKLQSKQEENMAKLQLQREEGQQDVQIEQQKLQIQVAEGQAKLQLEQAKAAQEMQLARQKMEFELQLERERVQAQLQIEQERVVGQLAIQRMQAANRPQPGESE